MPATEPATTDRTKLAAHVRRFLDDTKFVTLATVGDDGSPHAAVVWYHLGPDDTIMVNSADGRRWPADLRRDPRVALTIVDPADGYRWIGVTGVVERVDDDQAIAQADIAALARRYHAEDPEEAERLIERRFRRQHRVSFRIRPVAVHDELA